MKNKILLFLVLMSFESFAIISFDEGSLTIDGVQLYRDREKVNEYYYLPKFPRLATKEDGSFELLFMQYVGKDKAAGGGIFHALVQFDVPEDLLLQVEKKLKEKFPNAILMGQVPLRQSKSEDDNEATQPAFSIVSSILKVTDGQPASFTTSMVTSGFAPLSPGSKAAIAASLTEDGSTLLYESLKSPTSDVSVSISGYFDAAIKGYNAVITADVSTIYQHLSSISSNQEAYKKEQLRNIMDKLVQEQVIKISVFDGSQGDIKNDDLSQILTLVTNKLTELMFNTQSGWSVVPEKEIAVEKNQIPGRQKKGFLRGLFSGLTNAAYISDQQFTLKNRKDIRINKFYLNLSKESVIQVPIFATGNIGGIFQEYSKNDRYFRIVNMDAATFQKREVYFTIDREFTSNNSNLFNFVTVQLRKKYNVKQNDLTKELYFNYSELEKGVGSKTIIFSRLSEPQANWTDFEYRVAWSFRGLPNLITQPAEENEWIRTNEIGVVLHPPFEKRTIEIEVDKSEFAIKKIKAASVTFFTVLSGKPQISKTILFREPDANSKITSILCDFNEAAAYQVEWITANKSIPTGQITQLNSTYLNLSPPGN